MDNRIFNVNGSGKGMLLDTLKLAFLQEGDRTTAKGYSISKKHGMILYWAERNGKEGYIPFPTKMDASTILEFIWTWLNSDEAKEITCVGDDADHNHDGHNSLGWRVFCEGWGHVDGKHGTIVAVKPAYMWHGK